MLAYVFTSSLKDFLRPGRIVVWGLLSLGVAVMGYFWSSLGSPGTQQETYGYLASVIVYRFTALTAAIFSTMVVSQEIDQKTIVYLLTRTVPRSQMLLGRLLAAIVAVTAVAWTASFLGGFAVLGPGMFTARGWWADLPVLALGAAAYTVFFVFLSLVLNRAMVFSLLFAFGWETFVPNMPGDLYYVSIYTYLNSLSLHPRTAGRLPVLDALTGALNGNQVAYLTALVILSLIVATLLATSLVLFTKKEIVPREDGE